MRGKLGGTWRLPATEVRRRAEQAILVVALALVSTTCREPTAVKEGRAPNLALPAACRPALQQCPGYPPPVDPSPTAIGLYTNTYSLESCFREGPDLDADGVWDYCETRLAQIFAPVLSFGHDCSSDGAYNRPGGEYYYAVTRLRIYGEDRIRIAWLPAYYRDCGSPGGPHSGDAEFMIHEINYNTASAHWVTKRIFLSSHCYAVQFGFETDPDCQWWQPADIAGWHDGRIQGAPHIWVAIGKHAHYRSKAACNGGGYEPLWSDTCEAANQETRYPVLYSWQNIGSNSYRTTDATKPRWARAAWDTLLADTSKIEKFWTRDMEWASYIDAYGNLAWKQRPKRFNGWQSSTWGDYVAPYPTVLADFAFVTDPVVVSAPEVGILGEQTIRPYGNCTYQARVDFGTPPYRYRWVQNGYVIGLNDPWLVTDDGKSNFWLQLTVTDSQGIQRSSETVTVIVDSAAPMCIQ